MPTERAQDTEAIRAATGISEYLRGRAHDLVQGWYPNWSHVAWLREKADEADRLVARLEAAEALIVAHELTAGDRCPVCALDGEFLAEVGLLIAGLRVHEASRVGRGPELCGRAADALESMLRAGAAPGETDQTP